MATKPKKPVQPKQAKEIIGITPSSGTFGGKPGKATGATDFFKVDEQGKPLEQGQIVGGAFQTGQNVKAGQIPEQLTPEQLKALGKTPEKTPLEQGLAQVGSLPLAQPQTPAIGQGNGVISETPEDLANAEKQRQLLDLAIPGFGLGTAASLTQGTPEEKAQTQKQIAFDVALGVIGGVISRAIAAKAALNTAEGTASFTSRYATAAGAETVGKVSKVGELALNPKTVGQVGQILQTTWGKFTATAAGLSLLKSVFANFKDSYRYITTLNKIDDAIRINNDAMSKETVPQIREAYIEEQAELLQVRDDFVNPEGIKAFLSDVPFLDDYIGKKLIARANDDLSKSEARRAKELINKYVIIQEQANVLKDLNPDIRQALIDYAQSSRQEEAAAETLIKGGVV